MATDPHDNPLCEVNWRRKLTGSEQAQLRSWLTEHPEAQADWDAETALSEALGRLPDAALASDFTVRVMQAIDREAGEAERSRNHARTAWRWWVRWMPRAAGAAIALGVALV